MKRIRFILPMILMYVNCVLSQTINTAENKILLSGIIRDAATLTPLPNSQIMISKLFISASNEDGTFAIRMNRRDTVVFRLLGYHTVYYCISDTLAGNEFMAGVYMKSDTLSIGEVIIIPRIQSLKYDIYKAPARSPEIENAKYNMAVSAYQGRMSINKMGDPQTNYAVVHQKNLRDASEKGTIPSDRMIGLSPFMFVGAAYLLINGLPGKPESMGSNLTREELDQIHKKYLETLTKK